MSKSPYLPSHSNVFGESVKSWHSGFPSFERQPNKTYTTCPWNLNNLPVLQDSILSHIQTCVPGSRSVLRGHRD